MKMKLIAAALLATWGSAFAGSTADALSGQYNTTVTGSGGITTKINAAKAGSPTCDLACAAGGTPGYLPPPTDTSGGVASVSTFFKTFIGKTMRLRMLPPVSGSKFVEFALTPISANQATLVHEVPDPYNTTRTLLTNAGYTRYYRTDVSYYYYTKTQTVPNTTSPISWQGDTFTITPSTVELRRSESWSTGITCGWVGSYGVVEGDVGLNSDKLMANINTATTRSVSKELGKIYPDCG